MKLYSIEAVRAVAIFCVILIHTEPFLRLSTIQNGWFFLGQIIQQLSSFAVPFFYIVSGYFFSRGVSRKGLKNQFSQYFIRILILLLTWIVIDGVFWGGWLESIIEHGSLKPLLWNIMAVPGFALNRPDLFFFRGTAVPLWFLFSMLSGVAFLSILLFAKLNRLMILGVGLSAYILSLSVSFYSDTFIGVGFVLPLEQRGVFISICFLSIGYFLEDCQININGIKLLLISVVLMFVESIALSISQNGVFTEHPYLFSTVLVSIGVFLTALQNPMVGVNSFLCRVGGMSLGVYVVHIPVLGALNYYRDLVISPVWELFFPVLVLLLSLLIVSLFMRIPYLRKVVV